MSMYNLKTLSLYSHSPQNIYIIMENCDGGELLTVVENNFKNGRYVNERYVIFLSNNVYPELGGRWRYSVKFFQL
jgi:hypothetical protein